MTSPLKFFFRHTLIGFALSAVFVAALLYFDVMNLQTLLFKDERWRMALFIMWFGNGTVFGALQVAYAIMDLADD